MTLDEFFFTNFYVVLADFKVGERYTVVYSKIDKNRQGMVVSREARAPYQIGEFVKEKRHDKRFIPASSVEIPFTISREIFPMNYRTRAGDLVTVVSYDETKPEGIQILGYIQNSEGNWSQRGWFLTGRSHPLYTMSTDIVAYD